MRCIYQHRGKVVQDKANPDTPVGFINNALQQQVAAFVTPPDVVLQVQRVLGGVDQRKTSAQGMFIAVQQMKIGMTRRQSAAQRRFDLGQRTTRPRRLGETLRRHWQIVGQRCASWQD